MREQPDAYKTLQVDPEADADVIQAAYRRLAQKFHPDRAGGAETEEGRAAAERMVAINAAWEILRDSGRRAEYDRKRAGRAPLVPPPASPARPEPSPLHPRPAGGAPGGPGGGEGLTFGRYAGWRLDEIVRADPGYLEWLARTPAGRPYREEIDQLLRRVGRGPGDSGPQRGLPRR